METKNCKNCHALFTITDDDFAFLNSMSSTFDGILYQIPLPTHCPQCRLQRRIATRNELFLYKRKSDFSGANIISTYSPDKPYKIYSYEEWWNDSWNGLDFGLSIDWNRPFFDQFKELMKHVPRLALQNQARNENSPYINYATQNRNCYLIIASNGNEDVYYSMFTNNSKNSADCLFVRECEMSYECVDSQRLFQCSFCISCEQCSDSLFLYDCQGCSDSIACTGLRHKRFYWFNEELTEHEFKARRRALFEEGRPALEKLRAQWEKLMHNQPRFFIHGRHNENVSGDYIYNSKNAYECFDVTHLEDCKYCIWLHNGKNCYDFYAFGRPAEQCYECQTMGDNAYNIKFSFECWTNIANLEYCNLVIASQDCFGCIGLKRNRYCILNKQYSESEYFHIVAKLKKYMQQTGEYGEFFPISLSPYCYNETVAQEYFPLTEETVLAKGYTWKDEEPKDNMKATFKSPLNIQDVPDSITNEILACEQCSKNYRIIPQELRLYRMLNMPLPLKCFTCRLAARKRLRNRRQLWKRNCSQCNTLVKTSYNPSQPEIIYCEQCYLKIMY